MAEEFRVCSEGSSWWNPGAAAAAAAASLSSSSSLSRSTATTTGFFGWAAAAAELSEARAHGQYSCDESAGSACGSSITFQETPKLHQADHVGIDSSSGMSWTQALLRQDPIVDSNQVHASAQNLFGGINHGFLLDQYHHVDSLASFGGCSFQELLEPEMKTQQAAVHYLQQQQQPQPPRLMAYLSSSNDELRRQTPWPKFPHLLNSSSAYNNQSQFINDSTTPQWSNNVNNNSNSSNDTSSRDVKAAAVCYRPPTPLAASTKVNPGGARDACSSSSTAAKKTGGEPAIKKTRMETPSPLPSFKVRKEKLGDRITALQQLVSPFGKTDTASVLQETIDYIKFLHDQVGVLSSPYLKDGHPMKQKQIFEPSKDCDELKQDLRSRGLCLVPITSTYPVSSETTAADFWHPTFGGSFR